MKLDIKEYEEKMKKTVGVYKTDLDGVRVGRAKMCIRDRSMADAEVKESAGRLPLSNDWFARDDRIRLTSAPMKERLTAEFETAPGTEELIITVFGRIAAAFADDCEISFAFEGRNSYGAGIYRLVLPSGERGSKISIRCV